MAERPDPVGEPVVIGRHRASLAGGDDLARMEREARERTEAAARTPAVPGTERPGRVLEDRHGREPPGDARQPGAAVARPCQAEGGGVTHGSPAVPLLHASAGLRARYQAIVRSRPSSRSTFASKPSSSRAWRTFGLRTSTSA